MFIDVNRACAHQKAEPHFDSILQMILAGWARLRDSAGWEGDYHEGGVMIANMSGLPWLRSLSTRRSREALDCGLQSIAEPNGIPERIVESTHRRWQLGDRRTRPHAQFLD